MKAYALGLTVSVLFVVGGCGGGGVSSSSTSCSSAPPPCGGELVGSWKGVDACPTQGPQPLNIEDCPDAEFELMSTSGEDNVTEVFRADGTHTVTGSIDALVEYRLPVACVSTCANAETIVEQALAAQAT